MTQSKLARLQSESADTDSLFSDYGELVLLLDSEEPILEEALMDCTPKQLLKVIKVLEDQLNDLGGASKKNRELSKRFLYLRRFAIKQFRSKLGVGSENQLMQYEPHKDRNLEPFDELDFDQVE